MRASSRMTLHPTPPPQPLLRSINHACKFKDDITPHPPTPTPVQGWRCHEKRGKSAGRFSTRRLIHDPPPSSCRWLRCTCLFCLTFFCVINILTGKYHGVCDHRHELREILMAMKMGVMARFFGDFRVCQDQKSGTRWYQREPKNLGPKDEMYISASPWSCLELYHPLEN